MIRFFPRNRSTRSLGRSHILRFGAVGVLEPMESGIATNAAERTDSDYAKEIPLQVPRRCDQNTSELPQYGQGLLGSGCISNAPYCTNLGYTAG